MDFGKRALPHLQWKISLALKVWGWNCVVYAPLVFDNDYEEHYPEIVPDTEPLMRCKVLIGQMLEGLSVSDFIRLTDPTKEVAVVANTQFQVGTILRCNSKDGTEMNLKVVEVKSFHPLSKIHWGYLTVVI